MKRREFVTAVGTGTVTLGLAGCLTKDGSGGNESDGDGGTGGNRTGGNESGTGTTMGDAGGGSGTIRVATYKPFVEAPSTSPGDWVKREFEKDHPDATLKWFTPENELNYFIQRRKAGVSIDADVYVGLNVDDLIRIDANLPDKSLLRPVDTGAMSNAGRVRSELKFDPQNRAIPFDTGYISLVYDERKVSNPGTFDALTSSEYRGTLLAENAQTSDPGRAFMLWTIKAKGADGYIDYWKQLKRNDVKIFGSWNDAYGAYRKGERPIVVSYSTDQVYANRYDQNMKKHQVGFLNDQGYANPEGMAVFETSDEPELARTFLDWMLSKKVQSKIPVLNVQFPATDHAELDDSFEEYAHEPPEPVTYTYDELEGNLQGWIDRWAKEIASG